jgi:hypothetical protein
VSDFPERWQKALAADAEPPKVEVVITCAWHNLVLQPGVISESVIVPEPPEPVWACPDPTCPVKAHITIRTPTPATQEDAAWS